jgi:hypothetical protein
LFVTIVAGLFGLSLAAGTAGVFSSAVRGVDRDVQDPSKRLAAVSTLADQFAAGFANGQPTLPGTRDERQCPADYAARAATLIGALTPTDAASTMAAAERQLAQAGWRLNVSQLHARQPVIDASNREGMVVEVAEQAGDQLTTIRVTVIVPCSPTTASSAHAPTTAEGAGGS